MRRYGRNDYMAFSKSHLRDIKNASDFKRYRREVFAEYASYLKNTIKTNYDWSVKFIMWLRQYIRYIKAEKTFAPSYLPRYKRGQIVLINLGFRLGIELGGAHYGIVLDNDNRKKSGLITIIPMISKKNRHFEKGLAPWEYELPMPISRFIIEKAMKKLADTPRSLIYDQIAEALKLKETTGVDSSPIDIAVFDKMLEKQIAPLLAFAQKMSKGSIVDTRQILTVSKLRIITPVKASDELTDICVPEEFVTEICKMITKNYILPAGAVDSTDDNR